MHVKPTRRVVWAVGGVWLLFSNVALAVSDPTALVKAMLQHWRGNSSYTAITMRIQRPDWQRSMQLISWTRGKQDALVRFIAPPGDSGNATLKLGPSLWLFNPKLSQVIKLPFSMMAQNWMGSDFSYNDLAKSEQIVTDYTHTFGSVKEHGKHQIFTVVSIPKPNAPIVWGKVILNIRDDDVLLEETYYDQNMKPVRQLKTMQVSSLGGRPYPVVMRMSQLNKPGTWTELHYTKGVFNLQLPGYLFTLSNLRNPRPWNIP